MKQQLLDYWARLKGSVGEYYTAMSWSIVALSGFMLWLWVIAPYAEWRETTRDKIALDVQKTAKLQALQRSVEQWQSASDQMDADLQALQPHFVHADSYLQAQQALYNLMMAELKKNQLELLTHSFIESQNVAVGEQVALQISFKGALFDVIRFISAFPRHAYLLTFPGMSIIQNKEFAIVRMTVAGYRFKPTAAVSE